jgi:hypothetical protein
MRRARFMISLALFVGILLTFAPAAFAHADGGRGWWGETTDQQVTSVMFATIVLDHPVAAGQAQARPRGRGQGP